MTISSAYQSVSVTVAAFAVSSVTVGAMDAADREPAATTAAPAAEPPRDTLQLSRAARRADALLGAVDADRDGAVSEQEFTDGAMALLRRGRARHLHHRLAKLFDRVDGNQDGSISKEEMTAALQQVARRREPRRADAAQPAVASTTVASVTVVAVAIRQYRAAAQVTAA